MTLSIIKSPHHEHVSFTRIHMNVLSPCYARYEHTIKGYVTYYFGMLCEVTSAKHVMLYGVTSSKHAWVSLEKIWMGANGQIGGKNSSTLVPIAFISFGMFNIFLTQV